MTKIQTNKYSMYRSVCKVLSSNESYFSGIKILYDSSKKFEECFSKIEELNQIKNTVSKGVVIEKANAGQALVNSILKVAGVLFVFAKNTKNENLKNISSVTHSELKRIRINDFITKAKNILKNAKNSEPALKEYYTEIAVDIKEFENHLAVYEKSLDIKETKTAERISVKTTLSQEFSKADEILKDELDKLIELIKANNLDLYQQYFAARTIKDLGVKKIKKNDEKTA
jgi:hypothetical protein